MAKSVENLCNSKEMVAPCSKFKKYNDNDGFSEYMTINFGNLTAWSYRNGLKLFQAKVDFDKEGSLIGFSMGGRTDDVRALVVLLSETYGEPLVTEEQVQNGIGNKFTNEIYVWTDAQGTKIFVETIGKKIDQGILSIAAASLIESAEKSAAKRNEAHKSNL